MNKESLYCQLLTDMGLMLEGETDPVARMAEAAALIYERTGFFWVGFYRVVNDVLVLGPFQGPPACLRIARGKGVCGTAWQKASTIVVPDVEEFPGHIACSSLSRSEIVVPLRGSNGEVIGALDIDSKELATFDETDARWLEQIAQSIERHAFHNQQTTA